MSEDNGPDLAHVLGEVARALLSAQGVGDTLAAITAGAVHTIPGADFAGITLVRHRQQQVESVAASHDVVFQADQAQEQFGEGPCLSAIREHKTFRIDDMRDEARWPQFGPRALELGILSMLSFQLFTDEHTLGALNLYSRQANAFADNEAEQVGLLFATHAAVALRGAQQESQLKGAIDNRDLIGMAKGILMERHKIDPDRAFAMLVRTSQAGNVKLHAVAEFLVRTGASTA